MTALRFGMGMRILTVPGSEKNSKRRVRLSPDDPVGAEQIEAHFAQLDLTRQMGLRVRPAEGEPYAVVLDDNGQLEPSNNYFGRHHRWHAGQMGLEHNMVVGPEDLIDIYRAARLTPEE
ncbi:MAG: hypothetical protein AB7P76_12075 [Candidatus Melainabacteria bacterium]